MPLDVDNPNGELVVDPYKAKERYLNWDKRIPSLSRENEHIIVRYLEDMRQGINIGTRAPKGKRGYRRLLTQKNRLKRTFELLEQHFGVTSVVAASQTEFENLERTLGQLFDKMEEIVR